jgi:hypothetical protein
MVVQVVVDKNSVMQELELPIKDLMVVQILEVVQIVLQAAEEVQVALDKHNNQQMVVVVVME